MKRSKQLPHIDELYRTLFNSIDEGFCIIEMIFDTKNKPIDYRFLEANPVFEEQTGLVHAIGKTARELIPNLEKYWFETYGKVALTGEAIRFTQGSKSMGKWFDVYATRVGGKGSRQVALLFTDITQRKDSEKELSQSEERFRTLIEQSTDAIQLVSPEGKIIYTSASIKNVLGYTPEELNGLGVTPFLHPDDLEYFNRKLAEIITKPSKPILLHYRVKHKDGSWAWLETTGVNHLNTPNINALVGTFRNITERKKAEEELEYQKSLLEAQQEVSPLGTLIVSPKGKIVRYNQRFVEMWKLPKKILHTQIDELAIQAAQEQLIDPNGFKERVMHLYQCKEQSNDKILFKDGRIFERYGSPVIGKDNVYFGYVWFFMDITEREKLVKQKDDFLGIASHELKTPVTSVKVYTQLLQRRFLKSNDIESADIVSKMDAQLNKLTSLIADVLDATKIESGKLQFNQEHFDFSELVNETVEEVQRTTETHTIKQTVKKSQRIYGDRDRIGQVITNLLTNAIKYSPQSDKIIVETSSTKKDVTLSVQDFGVGIPKDKHDKLFERFYRVTGPKQDTFPGLGLGLYISAEIIKRLGGKIWFKSAEGKGSTFYIQLPKKSVSFQ